MALATSFLFHVSEQRSAQDPHEDHEIPLLDDALGVNVVAHIFLGQPCNVNVSVTQWTRRVSLFHKVWVKSQAVSGLY